MTSVRISAFISALLILIGNVATAQRIGLEIDLFGYADNREFKSTYTEDKTYFGTILTPQLYFAIDNTSRIYGGIQYKQDFGKHAQNGSDVSPVAYYNYKDKNFDFALGHMPRHDRLRNVPLMVLSDTLLYERPNLEGMYFSYRNENIQQTLYIDWLSKQSNDYRERFIVGLSGKYKFGRFYIADDALLYHNALSSNDSIEEHIQDNGIVLLRAGVDLSAMTFLDSLTIDAGFALGFDRVRTEYELRTSSGFLSNIHLGYKRFFIKNTFYLGDPQNLPMGDSFYHRDRYDRLELGWMPLKKGALEGKFTAAFHFDSQQVSNQQSFTLRYRFGSTLWRQKQ
ncbi:MAG: hypothetical protein ACTJHT_02250 [Sphingobacterium sp.]|uniref:hypothetical protein n=1 Tax=Sphingobacterium sp. JB170 TaxID=1434842 RepID=UPI00097E922A|nr:hypothetical protein [Sphingobacterium sp. JB170]SJN40060.1 hypothetical protein FM107_10420 [Sphingobacterium sp. JB170]